MVPPKRSEQQARDAHVGGQRCQLLSVPVCEHLARGKCVHLGQHPKVGRLLQQGTGPCCQLRDVYFRAAWALQQQGSWSAR